MTFESRQILRRNGIDPYTAKENLVWAPNWSHSEKYATDVLTRLKKVETQGHVEVASELNKIAIAFIDGKWSTHSGGDETDDS